MPTAEAVAAPPSPPPSAETFGLGCRACGAPRPLDTERCPCCDEVGRLSDEAVGRVEAHRARLRRALGALRVVLTHQISAAMSARQMPWTVAALFATIVLPPALGAALFTALLLHGDQWLALGAAFLSVAAGAAGLAAGVSVLHRFAKRVHQKSAGIARVCAPDLAATLAERCGQCGGQAATLAVATETALPCPWCDAELVPAADLEPSLRAASNVLLAHRSELSAPAFQAVMRRFRRPPRRASVPLAGFGRKAGLIRGVFAGVPIWSGDDAGAGETFVRVEAPAPCRLRGQWWWVRPAAEESMRAAALEWGYLLPQVAAGSPLAGLRAYVEPGRELPPLPSLPAALAKLAPRAALLTDDAGVSVWRHLRWVLTPGWMPLARHRETLAALAQELGRA